MYVENDIINCMNYIDLCLEEINQRRETQRQIQRRAEKERHENRIKRRNRTFFTNTDNDLIPRYLTAAKFSGIELKIYNDAYNILYDLVEGLSALHWKKCKPTKRQRRLFQLYLDSFRCLHEDEIAKNQDQMNILKFYNYDLLGWYR